MEIAIPHNVYLAAAAAGAGRGIKQHAALMDYVKAQGQDPQKFIGFRRASETELFVLLSE